MEPQTKLDKVLTKIMDAFGFGLRWVLIVVGTFEVIFQLIRFYFFRG